MVLSSGWILAHDGHSLSVRVESGSADPILLLRGNPTTKSLNLCSSGSLDA